MGETFVMSYDMRLQLQERFEAEGIPLGVSHRLWYGAEKPESEAVSERA